MKKFHDWRDDAATAMSDAYMAALMDRWSEVKEAREAGDMEGAERIAREALESAAPAALDKLLLHWPAPKA